MNAATLSMWSKWQAPVWILSFCINELSSSGGISSHYLVCNRIPLVYQINWRVWPVKFLYFVAFFYFTKFLKVVNVCWTFILHEIQLLIKCLVMFATVFYPFNAFAFDRWSIKMEPMTLGSPSSPSAANTSNYLPSYLMGEPNIMTVPRTNTLSPTKGRTLAFCKFIHHQI